MDMLLGILNSLGVNQTIWIQLIVFVFMFFFLKNYLFTPYVQAYEQRQASTKGNESEAEKIFAQTRELETVYQRKARNLNADIKNIYDKARSEGVRDQEKIVLSAREKSKADIEIVRQKVQVEFNNAREALIKEAPLIGESINARLVGEERK